MAVEPEEVSVVQPLPQPLPEPLVQLLPGFIPTLEEDGLQLRVAGKRKTYGRVKPATLIRKKKFPIEESQLNFKDSYSPFKQQCFYK